MNNNDSIPEERWDTPKSMVSEAMKSWRPRHNFEDETGSLVDNWVTSISQKYNKKAINDSIALSKVYFKHEDDDNLIKKLHMSKSNKNSADEKSE
jgi:hypothetical protein